MSFLPGAVSELLTGQDFLDSGAEKNLGHKPAIRSLPPHQRHITNVQDQSVSQALPQLSSLSYQQIHTITHVLLSAEGHPSPCCGGTMLPGPSPVCALGWWALQKG